MVSDSYRRALGEAKAHHASSKTYSGKFLRPHAPFIKEIIDRLGCKSVLDYGCGKGKQYEWVSHGDEASIPKGQTIEQFWGVDVCKYDPAYPPFELLAPGYFDLVICTHVLGSIPKADLADVLHLIFNRAGKAVYIAEKIGPVGKEVFSEPDLMPRGWSTGLWRATIAGERRIIGREKVETWVATREKTAVGVLVERVKL